MKKEPVFRKAGKEWNAWNQSAPTPRRSPREPFFRRQRRELSDAWREIYCNSRVRRIRTWQIAVFALMIVEAAVMAIAVHPAYWVGAGLLALLCVRQLFDRRPERHSAAGVVLYGVIAVLMRYHASNDLLQIEEREAVDVLERYAAFQYQNLPLII